MEQERDSKEYSWKWITASELLSRSPCELVYAFVFADGAHSGVYLYDGEDTSGKIIAQFQSGQKQGEPFSPRVPVYCRRGLYAVVASNVTGIFVQWREIPQGIGYPK